MALIRWSPYGELTSLHDQMDQLFQQVFGEPLSRHDGGDQVGLPVDIRQTESAYVLEASVPGFAPEQVELTFDNGILTIRGQRRDESESKHGEYVRRERRSASVFRQVSLPSEVEPDGITASFENGVLTVTVPRIARAQPKRIPVTSGSPRVVDAPAR
ncbi:MAG TPA: Hsp20/alpha crystallin family protein [Candidatus Binatia bacterium]|nr:Hsp20/alpha crystallin family protein [Candidatus Binatia bacterium]